MAVYKIFPYKDASLYSMFPTMNTGIDPILQVSNLNFALNTAPTVARSLVAFDSSEMQDVINNKVTGSWDAYLKGFIATAQGIVESSVLEIWPVGEYWWNGTGTYLDQPLTTDGASWNSPQFDGGKQWDGLSTGYNSGSGTTYFITASYLPASASAGGGNWVVYDSTGTNYQVTQTFDLRSDKDLKVGVTTIVNSWYSASSGLGGIINNGFLLKWENAAEFSPHKQVQPVLQYYSVDTNTIYPPTLEFRWDDFVWATSSAISVLNQPNAFISLAENPGIFYSGSVNRFRLNCRPKYPARVWSTSSLYTTQYYLPSGSTLYAVKDLDTDEYVIEFDNTYTQVSADTTSSYFDVYMNGLEPERYYKIQIQVTAGGSTTIYDDNYYFKVKNG